MGDDAGGPYELDSYSDSIAGARSTFDDVITLSTAHSGNLLASGAYFPFRFDLVAGSMDGAADWDADPLMAAEWGYAVRRQAVLREVRVVELVGSLGANQSFQRLGVGDCTLRSANGNDLAPVPEPASLLLLWRRDGGDGPARGRRALGGRIGRCRDGGPEGRDPRPVGGARLRSRRRTDVKTAPDAARPIPAPEIELRQRIPDLHVILRPRSSGPRRRRR
jgi:hypothetical protein